MWLLLTPWQWLQIIFRYSTFENWLQFRGISSFPAKQARHRVVCHAVSVGEIAALEPLVKGLTESGRDIEIVVTVGNKDGRASAERLRKRYTEILQVGFLPWDRYGAMVAWLQRVQPDLVVVMETELWPSLFMACKNLGISLYIANGRIYPADMGRYIFARRFFGQVLGCAAWIGVQDEHERERFIRIGAAPAVVHIVGNMKYDVPLPFGAITDKRLLQLENAGMLIVAGSTHSPEEQWIVESFQQLRKTYPSIRLVLAPRHVTRSDSIATMAEKEGMCVIRWSMGKIPSLEWDVLVLDEMGWLPAVYKHAAIAIIGGSFMNHGGHNILEPAAQGCAVVIGPHMQHFQTIAEDFNQANAILWIAHHEDLDAALMRMIGDEAFLCQLQDNARKFIQSRQGVADQYVKAIKDRLLGVSVDLSLLSDTAERLIIPMVHE